MCMATCICWKKSRKYLDMCCCMSAQHKGVGAGGGCAPSRAEREAEGNLQFKNEQNIQFRQLFILIRGELSTCVLCVWMVGTPKGGQPASKGDECPLPPPPLNETLLCMRERVRVSKGENYSRHWFDDDILTGFSTGLSSDPAFHASLRNAPSNCAWSIPVVKYVLCPSRDLRLEPSTQYCLPSKIIDINVQKCEQKRPFRFLYHSVTYAGKAHSYPWAS